MHGRLARCRQNIVFADLQKTEKRKKVPFPGNDEKPGMEENGRNKGSWADFRGL